MDGDDHDRTPARRGRGRPRKDAGLSDGLEGVRRQIACEVIADLIEEWAGRRVPTRELLDELLARLREGE
jgi:hypothetical protein